MGSQIGTVETGTPVSSCSTMEWWDFISISFMVDETMPFPSKRLLTPFRGRSGSYSSFWGLFSPKASGLIWKNGVSSCPHATDLQKRRGGVLFHVAPPWLIWPRVLFCWGQMGQDFPVLFEPRKIASGLPCPSAMEWVLCSCCGESLVSGPPTHLPLALSAHGWSHGWWGPRSVGRSVTWGQTWGRRP